MTSEIILIDKYEFETVRKNGSVTTLFFAVKGKTRYPMPDAFAEMYTDKYLAIQKVNPFDMSEVLGEGLDSEYYIPIFTGAKE